MEAVIIPSLHLSGRRTSDVANVEELIKEAKMLGEFALKYHPFRQRKMEAVKVANVTILSDIILSRTAKGK